MKKLFYEFIAWTAVPGGVLYVLLWGGAAFPIAWQENRGIEVAVTNCWLMAGLSVLVAAFSIAWLLDVFKVRRPYAIWSLSLASFYGIIAYGGALLHMYGITPSLHRFANDVYFFLIFFLSALAAMMYHIWKSVTHTAG